MRTIQRAGANSADRWLADFLGRLQRDDLAPATVRGYRYTFALNYLRQSPGKLVALASLLGHESLDTTAIDVRPSSEELAQDLERSRLNVDG